MVFGVSMALGAFLAGMVVGRSDFSLRAAAEALPMRDAFAVLFFVSVGMLFDPAALLDTPGLIARRAGDRAASASRCAALVIVLGVRYPLSGRARGGGRAGADRRVLVHPGDARARPRPADPGSHQRAGRGGDRLDHRSTRCCTGRSGRSSAGWRRVRRWRRGSAGGDDRRRPPPESACRRPRRHRAVVVGYGPIGRTLVRLLRENGIEPTVIELNMDTVRGLRDDGIDAVYGDASDRRR